MQKSMLFQVSIKLQGELQEGAEEKGKKANSGETIPIYTLFSNPTAAHSIT
jgi:hypothetical protein